MSFNRTPLGPKERRVVSKPLRQSAAMQPCTLRLPGVCNGRLDTTVLAHIRGWGNAGIGQKPHDIHGVYACFSCHNAIDRRDRMTAGEVGFEDILRALIETQSRMIAAGLIHVAGEATP